MTAPAPHGETGERAPLTALEWLRVTHAGTLSGRRIEEAVAAAEARGRAEALRDAADWLSGSSDGPAAPDWPEKLRRVDVAAMLRDRAVDAELSTPGGAE